MGQSSSRRTEPFMYGIVVKDEHPEIGDSDAERMRNVHIFENPVEMEEFIKNDIGVFPDGSYRKVFWVYQIFDDNGTRYGKRTFTNAYDNHPIPMQTNDINL